jgi:hypothetical protein
MESQLKWWKTNPQEALMNRHDSLVELFNNRETNYPMSVSMYGFPRLTLYTRTELFARIRELADILGLDTPEITTELETGTQIISHGIPTSKK